MMGLQFNTQEQPSVDVSHLSLCSSLSSLIICPVDLTSSSLHRHTDLPPQFRESTGFPLGSPAPCRGLKLSQGRKPGQLEDLPGLFPIFPIILLGYLISSVLKTAISYILATFWFFQQENKSSLCYSVFAESRSPEH